ncbi:hypothetical protein ACWEKT_17795 [Nocardia takedensis]|uniref:hypothetical protein n=1 Tax=Nocardia takedensis TaxID=259390 RepID=UPI0002EF1AC2|nr:hypothetical protein [Nocardia takedensis]
MTRFLAVLSGALLVLAVTLMQPFAAVPALILVVAGWWLRPFAVAAVLAALAVLVLADTGVIASASVGLVATAYLLNIATVSAPVGVVPTTIPSVVGAVVFVGCAVAAALLPVRIAWAPLVAPAVVLVLYGLLVHGLSVRWRGEHAVRE